MDPHQTRLIRLLENGCEDIPMLQEAVSSCLQNTEQKEIQKVLEGSGDADSVREPTFVPVVATSSETSELAAPTPVGVTSSNVAFGPLDFSVPASQCMSPLEIAVLTQNNVAVEVLLRGGAQPDHISGLSCSCLCKVCYTFPGNIKMIRTLLEAGANPDATTNNDTNSASCLIISLVKDNVEAVKALLEYGSDVSYEWKGQNALSMALDFKKDEIVTLLENHEYRRAQDNRWRRFTDRKHLEENRELQRKALHRQIQLEDQRKSMLRRSHSKDPMMHAATHHAGAQPTNSRVAPNSMTQGGSSTAAAAASLGQHVAQLVSSSNSASPHRPDDDGESKADASSATGVVEALQSKPNSRGAWQSATTSPSPPPHPAVEDSGVDRGAAPASAAEAIVGVSPSRVPMVLAAHQALNEASSSGIDASVISSMSSMEWIIPKEDVVLLDPISSGAHGDVFTGRLASIDELVAVKRFPCLDAKSRDCFRQEVTMLSKFRHENIVMFKGAIIAPDMCCILSELCVENLLDRLHRSGSIPWAQRLRWARDIAKSMNYLHTRVPQVVHRDLKSLNVLLDSNSTVKLCDFGMARLREHTYIATQHISGSPSWMAPEVLRGDDFDDKSDVYAFGVIMWEILTRKIPWPDKNMAQLVGLVGFGGHRLEIPATLPEGCPATYVSLMKQCWGDPADRPTFKLIRTQLETMMTSMD